MWLKGKGFAFHPYSSYYPRDRQVNGLTPITPNNSTCPLTSNRTQGICMTVNRSKQSPDSGPRHNKKIIAIVCIVSVLAVLTASYITRSIKLNSTAQSSQNLETTARQLLTIVEANYSDHGFYPPGRDDLQKVVAAYDPNLIAIFQGETTKVDFTPTEPPE